MFTINDINTLIFQTEDFMFRTPKTDMNDALYPTILAQAQKAYAILKGCQDKINEGHELKDTSIEIAVTKAVCTLQVIDILVAQNLPEYTHAK